MLRNCLKIASYTLLKSVPNSQTLSSAIRPFSQSILCPRVAVYQVVRHKGKRSKKQNSDSDSDPKNSELSEDPVLNRHSKVMTLSVTSLRVDGILRGALGIARNKIETLFYENKILVNGQKISKKSVTIHPGDEVDLIKGPDVRNPNFMTVARVEVLSIKANGEESIDVKVRRNKTLSIESIL
ncbi:hypothetical protein D910_06404 [Dendroctonus ponderosae]